MVAIFPLTINKTDFRISFSFKNIRTMINIVNILKPYICHLFYIYIYVCVCVCIHILDLSGSFSVTCIITDNIL